MKLTKRILCTALVAVMLLSVVLTGCSAPKLTIGGTSKVAGTIGANEVPTGEYLAYLYNTFYEMYYNQGLYQYEMYGMDVWTQEFTYGEGDDAQKLQFSDYVVRQAQDSMVRQEALRQLMKKHDITWIEEDEKEIDEELSKMEKDAFLVVGFSNKNYIKAYKNLYLNERSLFYGLYGKGGEREVADKDLRAYFDKNYLSYKMISLNLTDSEGKELDKKGKQKILDQLNGYLEQYNKDKNFEAVMDTYNKANAAKDEKVEPSKDEDNRVNGDANDMDADLAEAIRKVKVGSAQVVEYKAGGSTPTAALILRLDINEPKELYTDSYEDILSAMKYEEFDEEVTKKANGITYTFKKSVVKACKPENFLSDLA